MRAKRKGTDSYSRIARVQLEDSDILYHASVIEFEPDTPSTDSKPCPQTDEDKHWQEIRAKSAIAALQGLCANSKLVSTGTFEITYDISVCKAVELADALIEQLKKKLKG